MFDTRSTGHKRRGKYALLVIAVLIFGTIFAACGGGDDDDGDAGTTSASSNGEAKSVYLNAYAQEIQYFRDWFDGATDAAEALGWTVSSDFGNTTPEQQVQQIENALVQQPDGMLVTVLDADSASPVLRQARDQDVAVITVGGNVSDESIPNSFVARDNVDIGRQKAQFVVDQLGGKGTVGIIHGIRGLTFSEDQAEGYAEVLDAESGIKVVDGPYAGGFSADLGLDTTSNLLTSNPDLDAIIYDNDDLAMGGVQAVRDRGINLDDILIIGTDGGDAALEAVTKGEIDMTISLCGYAEGANAINILNGYFETGEVEPRVVSHVEEFTTENIKEKQASLTREECA